MLTHCVHHSTRSTYKVGELSKCTFISLTASAPWLLLPFTPSRRKEFWWTQVIAVATSTAACLVLVITSIITLTASSGGSGIGDVGGVGGGGGGAAIASAFVQSLTAASNGTATTSGGGGSSGSGSGGTDLPLSYAAISTSIGSVMLAFSGHMVFPTLQMDLAAVAAPGTSRTQGYSATRNFVDGPNAPQRHYQGLGRAICYAYAFILAVFASVGTLGAAAAMSRVGDGQNTTAVVNASSNGGGGGGGLGGNALLSIPESEAAWRDAGLVLMTVHILFVMVQVKSHTGLVRSNGRAGVCAWMNSVCCVRVGSTYS